MRITSRPLTELFARTDIRVEEYLEIANHPELQQRRIELVEGRLVEKGTSPHMVSNKRNSTLATKIAHYFYLAIGETDAGDVTGADGGYLVGPNRVVQPDVGFMRRDRAGDPDAVLYEGAPDIAVEVVSPNESAPSVIAKAKLYLGAGGTIVWAVYDKDSSVVEYRQGARDLTVTVFSGDDILIADDVLPTFELPLHVLFHRN